MKLTTTLTNQLFASQALSSYLGPIKNPYKDTIFENYYLLNNKTKGTFGEKIAEEISKTLNRPTSKRTNSGHDIIINNVKTEVKVSLATNGQNDVFTFNHLAASKDFDRILLVGLCVSHTYMVWLTKESFIDFTIMGAYFKPQQGGKKSKNDDYMYVTRGSWENFINEPCVHDFSIKW